MGHPVGAKMVQLLKKKEDTIEATPEKNQKSMISRNVQIESENILRNIQRILFLMNLAMRISIEQG